MPPGPAHPDPVVGAHHRLDRGDQAAGRGPPGRGAVRLLDAVHRQPVRDDHEVVAHGLHPRQAAGRRAHPVGGRTSGWPDTRCRAGRIVARAPPRRRWSHDGHLDRADDTDHDRHRLRERADQAARRTPGALDSGYALSAFFLALPAFVLVVTDLALGVGLAVLVGGVLLLWVAVMVARGFARFERIRLRGMLGKPADDPGLPVPAARGRLLAQGAAAAARRAVVAGRGLVAGRAGHRDGRLLAGGGLVGGGRGRPHLLVLAALDPLRPRREHHAGRAARLRRGPAPRDRAQPGARRVRAGHPAAGDAVRRRPARQPGPRAAQQPRRAPAGGTPGRGRPRRGPRRRGGLAAPARARHPRRPAAAAGPAQHGPRPGPQAAGRGPRTGPARRSTPRCSRPARPSTSCARCRAGSRRRCWSTAASPPPSAS